MRGASALVLAIGVAAAACDRGDGQVSPERREAQARQDSVRMTQKALLDSGVTVDTQKIDTGGGKGGTPVEGN